MVTNYQSSDGSPTSPVESNQITLQVGERRFLTTRKTLTEGSGYFSSLLSGRWDNNLQPDGSYFVDADPETFEHILRYLRRGIFPIFYDKVKGHDHAKYLALLEEAKYFQVDPLEEWLAGKKYLEAVKVVYTPQEADDDLVVSWKEGSETDIEYKPSWVVKKVYVCPRDIFIHRGNPQACGRQCRNAQQGREYDYKDEAVLKAVVIRKTTIFDQNLCLYSESSAN